MIVTLPTWLTLVVDAVVYGVSCVVAGWWYRRKPSAQLPRTGRLLALRRFETGGGWYERRLQIKRWKDRLPETGGRRGGMSKRRLPGRRAEDLDRFATECRRGELTHWATVGFTPVYRLWNSTETFAMVACCSIAGAVPCIAVLRYNRARIAVLPPRGQDRVVDGPVQPMGTPLV